MIRDDNTIEDILGAMMCLVMDIECLKEGGTPEFPVKSQLADLDERLRHKMNRTKNVTVSHWFRRGYEEYAQILENMGSAQPDLEKVLEKFSIVEEMFVSGNKANRRKIDFIVGEQGEVKPVQ
jgi:hypothetical protein